MANPGWMFHPTGGKQLYPDLTPAFQKQLEGEGWVDSPDKLEKKGLAHTGAASPLRTAVVAPTLADVRALFTLSEIIARYSADELKAAGLVPARDIKDISIDELIGRTGTDILTSAEALERIGRIVDADGDKITNDLSDDELVQVIGGMSINEVEVVAGQLGIPIEARTEFGYPLGVREDLIRALRPGLLSEPMIDPPSDDEPQHDASLETATEGELTGDTEAQLVGEITTDQFGDASPTNRQAWLEADSTTKKLITNLLDAKGVVYKDRDPKATLGQQLLDAFAPQPE